MVTSTAACPECGTATAPFRYTCAACGAFLDGAGVAPEAWPEPAPAATVAEPEPALALDPELEVQPEREALDGADEPEPVEWPSAAAAVPPQSSLPTLPTVPRVPAGAWLPPSALLTGLDAPAATTAGTAAGPAALGRSSVATTPRDWLAPFGTAERRWAAARRAIAIGAAVVVFGFLLPWAGSSIGNVLNVWTSVWGFAGSGHWLIAIGVAALGMVAASAGRLASVPLGVPAIAIASLVLGLIWPSLLGSSRPIGILVVFAGVVVVAAGGVLHLGARHDAATPDV